MRFAPQRRPNGARPCQYRISRKAPSAEEVEHLKKDGASAPQDAELQIDAVSVIIPDSV